MSVLVRRIFSAVFVLCLCGGSWGQDWPTLRRTNYVALLGTAGKDMKLQVQSKRHAGYGDELGYTLVGPDSNEILSGGVPLDGSKTITAAPRTDGLCALELEIGWNVAFFDAGETPSAFIAKEDLPLQTIQGTQRLYFYVPEKCKRFGVFVLADVTGEGARIVVYSPDGQVAKEEEGDYDSRTQIKVDVPAGADGKVWSLAVLKPKAAGLNLDDVALSLDPKLPPYLSKREDWALMFGQRKHE